MRLRSAIGCVAGATSGVILFLICINIPGIASQPFLIYIEKQEAEAINLSLVFLLAMLPLLTNIIMAIVIARFALRMWPIDISGKSRRGLLIISSGILVVCGIRAVILLWDTWLIEDAVDIAVLLVLDLELSYMIVIGGAASIFRWMHSHASHYVDRGFILFLRRFSSFADRTIVAEILKAAPRGRSVLFIASPRDRAANWDPFVWSMAGLRILNPLKKPSYSAEDR